MDFYVESYFPKISNCVTVPFGATTCKRELMLSNCVVPLICLCCCRRGSRGHTSTTNYFKCRGQSMAREVVFMRVALWGKVCFRIAQQTIHVYKSNNNISVIAFVWICAKTVSHFRDYDKTIKLITFNYTVYTNVSACGRFSGKYTIFEWPQWRSTH